MKIFKTFFEGGVLFSWLILLLTYGLVINDGKSFGVYDGDYSPSNKLIVSFIIVGFLQTQIMIKQEIQKLKDEL